MFSAEFLASSFLLFFHYKHGYYKILGKFSCCAAGPCCSSILLIVVCVLRLPRWHSGKESSCQHKRCRFDPWIIKRPWRRKWQPTPVFLPGKFCGQRSVLKSGMQLSQLTLTHAHAHTHTHTVCIC